MKGPRFLRFCAAILDVLNEIGGAGSASEVTDLVVERMAITEDELSETTKTGIARVRNQVAWARMYLVNDGWIDPGRRGVWELTQKGAGVRLTDENVYELFKRVQAVHQARAKEKAAVQLDESTIEVDVDDTPPSPDSANARDQLLEILRKLPPAGFEKLCQRLLREAGFERVEVTGRSGDGGIDGQGLLQINPFVSFKVLFQCKRYAGSVSASQVRDFRGAMAGRADKGLMITTGSFTAEARKEARRDGVHPIELVDADQLISMFEMFELGMRRTVAFDVDHSFFTTYGE